MIKAQLQKNLNGKPDKFEAGRGYVDGGVDYE
jgi:hypothetical protein